MLGKLSVVRATFKVGVKPSQIARQFGLTQSDVRQARSRRRTEANIESR
jgi:hypothetical protein